MNTATEQQPWEKCANVLAETKWNRQQVISSIMSACIDHARNETAALTQENERLREACQKAYELSMMRSEPYIPQDVREQIESTLHAALEGKEGKA